MLLIWRLLASLLIWRLLASGGSLVDPGPLTICTLTICKTFDLVAFGLSGLPGPPGSPYYKRNAFDLVAFGFWGLPGRPGSPNYKHNAFDLVAFGFWGLPGRPGSPYYKQNFHLAAFGFSGTPWWSTRVPFWPRGSPVDPGPLTMCKMLLIWWLLASRVSPVDPGPLTMCKMLLIWCACWASFQGS